MSIKSTFRNDSIVHHYTTTYYIIQLLRTIAWKKDYTKHSIMLTLSWTFFWFHTSIVAYTLPIWILLALYYYTIEETITTNTTTTTTIENLTDELKEIQLELSLLLPSPESKDRFRRRSLFILDSSLCHKATLLTVIYTIWITLLSVFSGQKIAWFLGCFILTWNSPLFKVIRDSCHRAQLFWLFNKHSNTTKSIKSNHHNNNSSQLSTNDHTDRFYRFLIIEHQRWWLHCGWTSLLLPNDRPEWSDEYLSKVPSISSFHLPSPTTKFDKVTQKSIKISWEWATPEWHIDENHNVDKNGWEYGTWDWTAWSTKSSGLRVLTRRRHWIRNARLVKQDITTETSTTTLPISIRSSNRNTCASISTSYSSEDSFMCTTPTTASPSLSKSLSINTSALSLKHVEPTLLFSDRSATTMESSLWLRR